MASSANAAAGAAAKKLRVACFHGYTSNAFVFNRRCGAIRRACRDVADFHFINGPHLVQPISGLSGLGGPESQDSVVDEKTPLEEQPRAWWKARDDGTYDGWDETVSFLNEQLEQHGPFDAIMGFSQGACLAGLMASALEKPERMPGLKLRADQGPLKLCVAISGFRSREPRHKALFEEKIQTPMLCVLGKEDSIVDAERSMSLTDACANVRVEWHEGGHATPSQAPWRNFFRDLFASFLPSQVEGTDWHTIPGPSARPKGNTPHGLNSHDVSANNSGTSTPVTGQSASGKTLADLEREEDERERDMARGQKGEEEGGGKRPAL